MKAIIEVDIHAITCPGTFLRDYEYVYLHMEMLGLEARTKSVPPTFPFFVHERLKFERTYDCSDPSVVAALLKGEDCVLELRQHVDYISDGKVIAHCSSNTYDFLYPAIPTYYGSGREILLYKTSKFKPIRITGEPIKLEFSTKTTIKEIPDYTSPIRSPRRATSPSRGLGSSSVASLPSLHTRSTTAPLPRPLRSPSPARRALDRSIAAYETELALTTARLRRSTDAERLRRSIEADRLSRSLRNLSASYIYDSDDDLDVIRSSLREERNAINDAIIKADREAFYKSLNRTL